MNRLTEKDSKGRLVPLDDMSNCFGEQVYQIQRRLAAYEDSGLGPKEIARVQAALDTIPFGRFYEIMQAERDGRCMVLPCKVGDALPDSDDAEYLHKITAVGFLVNCNEDSEWFSLADFYADHSGLNHEAAEVALAQEGGQDE